MSLLVSLIYAQVTFSEAAKWAIWNFSVFIIVLLIFIFGVELMGHIPLFLSCLEFLGNTIFTSWNIWKGRSLEFFDHHLCYFQRGLCHCSLAGPGEGRLWAKFGEWMVWISPKGLTRIWFPEEIVFNEEIHMVHSAPGFGWLLQVCGRDGAHLASFHSDSPFHPRNHSKMQVGERLR